MPGVLLLSRSRMKPKRVLPAFGSMLTRLLRRARPPVHSQRKVQLGEREKGGTALRTRPTPGPTQATPTYPCSGPCEARAHRGSGRVAVVTGDALRGANRRASGAGRGSRKCVAAGAMAALSVVCLLLAAASWRPVSASGEEFWPGQSAADILSGVASRRR